MRSVLLGALLATFAASALGRYLPPETFANISQSRQDTNLAIITSTTIVSIPGTPALSIPSSIYLTGSIDKSNDDSDELVTTQSLEESANDDLWFKHIDKGKSLMCAICGTDAAAGWQAFGTRTPPSAASKWVKSYDMAAWYWFEAKFDPDICDMDRYWGMRTTFQALKVSPKSNKAGNGLQCFQIRHQNENARFPDGKPRPRQEQSYIVDGKLYHVRTKPERDGLFKIADDPDQATNAEHFLAMDVRAAATVEIIGRVLRGRGREAYESWPGQYFDSGSTGGLALLGSPIGATVGFFLMQHKKELGNKYVSGVGVLRNDGTEYDTHDEVDLVFHIEGVAPEKQIIDEPMDVDPPQGLSETDDLAVAVAANLIPRNTAMYWVEEQVLGSNTILRVHKMMVR
ncbi:hypothetical protein N0V86_003878 [Didymella sp. IMI 355093]|nr:hypothetical protein N0V86_003878 [Didymella sp. IMI 355093]